MVIRSGQMQSFSQAALGLFEQRMLTHIETHFPLHWRRAGKRQMLILVRLGLAQASTYGLTAEREAALYINLMLAHGSGFDRDPQLAWAREILTDAGEPNPYRRAMALAARSQQHQEAVLGPGGAHLQAALGRAREPLAQDPVQLDALNVNSMSLSLWLQSLYPEKFEAIGPEAVQRLLTASLPAALALGLPRTAGTLLLTGFFFLLGRGFDTDPQFPWAEIALRQSEDPYSKLRHLQAAALTALDAWTKD